MSTSSPSVDVVVATCNRPDNVRICLQLLPDGTLMGDFAADTSHDLDVDHVLGANRSVLGAALERVGGIVDLCPGACLREESVFVRRLGRAGHRVVYTPAAAVRHVAATYARGRRFYGTALRQAGTDVVDGAKPVVTSRRSSRQRVRAAGGRAVHASSVLGGLAVGTTAAVGTRLGDRRTSRV